MGGNLAAEAAGRAARPPCSGPGGGVSWPPEHLCLRDSSNTDPVRSKIPVQAKVNANTSMATAPLSGWAASTPAHKPAVSRVLTVTVRAIRGLSRAGWRGG